MNVHALVHRLTRRHDAHADRMILIGRHAAAYDLVTTRMLAGLYRAVAKRVLTSVPQAGHVLDVGTGPRRLLTELGARRHDVRLAGIDPSADMIDHATRRLREAALTGRAELHVASAEDLPFPDGTFDAVVSTLSSHHWADPQQAVAEQARVLRSGGTLWIVDLRAKAPGTVTDALADEFAPASISRERLGRFMSSLIGCQRAEKSSSNDIATSAAHTEPVRADDTPGHQPVTVAEASISTPRADRYLEQLCQHLDHLSRIPVGHRRAHGPKITGPVRRSGDSAKVGFDLGTLSMAATASHLTLRIETDDAAAMETLKEQVSHRVATISRRDKLLITWRQVD